MLVGGSRFSRALEMMTLAHSFSQRLRACSKVQLCKAARLAGGLEGNTFHSPNLCCMT